MASRRFGPFEIHEQLGQGGMGIVYRATYVKSGQEVALKVLSPNVSEDLRVQKRFDREMEILKRLDHKLIVRYYGGGTIGNQRFFAMELMEGGSLEDILKKKKRLSWEQTIDVGKAVAKALEHAHYHGIIHRDLKPANLFLSKGGRLKLGDFGIAQDTGRTAITAAGRTVGTYAYMAPEQISGKPPVSGKTDQYALGCMLFELLTGKPPFDGDNPAEMLMAHLELKPPRVSLQAPDCPIWLENIINRLLEKEPENRFFDALALHNALDQVAARVAEGASIAKQTVVGDATVLGTAQDPELKKLLGKKKKKKKRSHQPFYEKTWFLATCLALLIAVVTWAVWPLSDEEKFVRGKKLMEQAAAMEVDDDDRWELFDEAKKKYFQPLMESDPDGPFAKDVKAYLFDIRTDELRRQAEARRKFGQEPRSQAERLYMNARQAEADEDRMLAIDRYGRLIKLIGDRDDDKIYVRLAKQRREAIYGEGSESTRSQEIVQDALNRAEKLFQSGKTIAATELWNAIISEFDGNKELAPLVDQARDRLKVKPKTSDNN